MPTRINAPKLSVMMKLLLLEMLGLDAELGLSDQAGLFLEQRGLNLLRGHQLSLEVVVFALLRKDFDLVEGGEILVLERRQQRIAGEHRIGGGLGRIGSGGRSCCPQGRAEATGFRSHRGCHRRELKKSRSFL